MWTGCPRIKKIMKGNIKSIDQYFNGKRWRGGRGKNKYCFMLTDIARVKGIKLQSVRNDLVKKKFNPADLESIIRYCEKQIS